MRYRAYQDTDGEVVLLKNYLTKYADTDQSIFDDLIIVNDKIKRLLGKTISGISKKYYELVREGSRRMVPLLTNYEKSQKPLKFSGMILYIVKSMKNT